MREDPEIIIVEELMNRLWWAYPGQTPEWIGSRAVDMFAGNDPDVQRWRNLGQPKEKRA